MNKQEIIHKIKSVEALTSLDKSYLIDLVNTKKNYGLVWNEKPEAVEEKLRTSLPILNEVSDKRILGSQIINNKNTENPELFDNNNLDHDSIVNAIPNHVLIEGDNLHALTALSFTHENKIDVIYIDPPYNTGKENEFRYNDKWILKEDPFRHSSWLSFISKRLSIAKRLLSESGVMIIHIDENEFDALNLLLETEIFSEANSLGQIIWNKQNPKGDAKEVATMHEYLLVYAKDKEAFQLLDNALLRPKPNAQKILNKAKRLFAKIGKTEIPEEIKEVIKPFNFPREKLKDFEIKYDLELVNKEFQSWLSRQDFSGGEKAYKFIDIKGKVYQSVSMAWPNKEIAPDDYWIPLIHPDTGQPCPLPSRGWRNPSKTMEKLLEKDLILFGVDETTQPRRKYLLEENMYENTPSIYNNGASDDELFNNLGISFPYPKPVEVASYFLKSIHPNPKIILDFFAGSGTTLHATMQLNDEDNGQRQCILITNNENNICEEVTYLRNNKIIEGYTNKANELVKGLSENNLRYYKCNEPNFVPSFKSETNRRLLTQSSTDLLCIKEDCYTDLTEDNGFNIKQCRIYTNDAGKYLIIVYHSRQQIQVCEQLAEYIKTLNGLSEKVRLYGFSPEKETLTEDFIEVADKIEAVPLPEAIYNAYRATFKAIKLDKKRPVSFVEPNAEINFNEVEAEN
jgi:adenine-specific DNA-methyltransferase